MAKGRKSPSEVTIKKLLERYNCPVPFHEVRTRFLGNIASPTVSLSPLVVLKELWDGELPTFDSLDEANELINALVQGLWNDLTQHQKRSHPFWLVRLPMEPNKANIGRFSLVRLQELDGFIRGLFGSEEEIDLPERAHEALGHLDELRSIMAGINELISRDPNADHEQFDDSFMHLRSLTRIMETEIHEAVLSCTRARRQSLDSILTQKPTVH
jgi:hypothetical protein